MIDLTFKIVAGILFIVGIIIRFSAGKAPQEGATLMIAGVFIFLFAQIICELRGIRENLEKK